MTTIVGAVARIIFIKNVRIESSCDVFGEHKHAVVAISTLRGASTAAPTAWLTQRSATVEMKVVRKSIVMMSLLNKACFLSEEYSIVVY